MDSKVTPLDRHSPRRPVLQPLHHHLHLLQQSPQVTELPLLLHRLLARPQLVTVRYVFACCVTHAC
jgi:hypothetical protein